MNKLTVGQAVRIDPVAGSSWKGMLRRWLVSGVSTYGTKLAI